MAGPNKGKSNKNQVSDANEETFNELPEKKESKAIGIINLGTFPLFIIAAILVVKYIVDKDFKTCTCITSTYISQFYPTKWDFEGKLAFLSLAWIHPALLVIFLVVLVMLTRVVGNVNPLKSGEPLWITMLNRCIQNTLEQSFVFLGLFFYYILNVSTEETKNLALTYLLIFVAGRIIFVVGYMFFWLTGLLGFRAAGFLITLTAQIFLISVIFGNDLTFKFSEYIGVYIKF